MSSVRRWPVFVVIELQQHVRVYHDDTHSEHGRIVRVFQQQHARQNVGHFDAIPVPFPGGIQVRIFRAWPSACSETKKNM